MFVDEQCGYNFNEQPDIYKKRCKMYKTNSKQKLVIVFSNNFEFIKGICKMYPKPNIVINITENLSEYHMANTLKYVSDVGYFKSGINTLLQSLYIFLHLLDIELLHQYNLQYFHLLH